MPKKLVYPTFVLYDGTSDPDEHMAQYKQRMLAISIPRSVREACMCRGFGMTLTGSALQWYIKIPVRSVSSFADLYDKFVHQFASSKRLEKTADDLYHLHIESGESLRDYLGRFNKERLTITNPDEAVCINAFRKGLFPSMPLYRELTMSPPRS